MKIASVRTFVIDCFRTNWVFVKVETDEGISGIGEGTLEYKENALVGAVKDLEHALVGKDPFDTEWIVHENYRDAYWRGGSWCLLTPLRIAFVSLTFLWWSGRVSLLPIMYLTRFRQEI